MTVINPPPPLPRGRKPDAGSCYRNSADRIDIKSTRGENHEFNFGEEKRQRKRGGRSLFTRENTRLPEKSARMLETPHLKLKDGTEVFEN